MSGELKRKDKAKWQLVCCIALTSLLAVTLVGCNLFGKKDSGVDAYLGQIADIVNDATDIAEDVSDLYLNSDRYSNTQIAGMCLNYAMEYDGLLRRLVELEHPQECSKLREYTVDMITYSKREVNEYGAYFTTSNIEHMYQAESYYDQAQRAAALAAGEWDRLR